MRRYWVGTVEIGGTVITILDLGWWTIKIYFLSNEIQIAAESVLPWMLIHGGWRFSYQHVFRLKSIWRGVFARYVRGVFMIRFHVLLSFLLRTNVLPPFNFLFNSLCDGLVDRWDRNVIKGCSSVSAIGKSKIAAKLIIILWLIQIRLEVWGFWVHISLIVFVLLVQMAYVGEAGAPRGADNLSILWGCNYNTAPI